jgi:hypothetical protein
MDDTENRFKHKGVWYIAVEQDGCRNCAFYGGDKQCSAPIPEVNLVPRCGSLREDDRSVIFVESDADNFGDEE